MGNKLSAIFFDRNDYQLLNIVDDVLESGGKPQAMHSLLVEHMHPQGIKEMAASRGLRIAFAVASLLGSFEQGKASDRIKALRSLRDEVILSSTTYYKKNTARVLLQIMKELLRCEGNQVHRLKLAHDFLMVSTGTPRRVRSELAKHHLVEMPEEWTQYAFDDHVHDANTKGRKSPTHLVMDAWIKGIRHLTVVYYNHVSPKVIEELIEACAILDIKVQVGIEMLSHFRDKYVRFTWEPHGLDDKKSFLEFLKDNTVEEMMEEGRKISRYQQRYVFEVLEIYNHRHRLSLNRDLQLTLQPLRRHDFLDFVGAGQPSLLHLARFIHNDFITHIEKQTPEILSELDKADTESKNPLIHRIERLKAVTVETIVEQYLQPSRNPGIHDPGHPQDHPELPRMLRLSPHELLRKLLSLHSSSKFTLNLSNLSVQDTLELLYSCGGMITHIEAYNLKNALHGIISGKTGGMAGTSGESVDLKSPEKHYSLIGDLQKSLNEDNVITLKRAIRAIITDYQEQRHRLKKHIEISRGKQKETEELEMEYNQMRERKKQLSNILYHLETFHNYYKNRILGSRIGSGSTGQAEHQYGMGLAIFETLSARGKRAVRKEVALNKRTFIPVTARLTRNSHKSRSDLPKFTGKKRFLNRLALLKKSRYRQWLDWSINSLTVHPQFPGNIATLGGIGRNDAREKLFSSTKNEERLGQPLKYINTNLKNSLKVLLGFIPAFLTFFLTKDWWVLAYLGAFIWFGITGARNIIQSILGGGGVRRSPLLPWNSLISWSRISDSLLYTGFSVPLLDYIVKTLLLDQGLGVTTATNPILLYSVMGLANGIYISSHNIFRGLPKTAATGNFFRSIIAIPLAILLNSILGMLLQFAGIIDVSGALQKWAAIISKFASDCVAGVIEGVADRQINIQARLTAYRTKISQLFAVFSRLDLQFPQEDVLEILQTPKMMMETLNYEARDQEKLIIVNALDLMYFWMYQPRARRALKVICETMSQEEWLIFYRSQLILKRYREISQVFVDGLVGKNFSRALSFYLDRSEEYLSDLEKLGATKQFVSSIPRYID